MKHKKEMEFPVIIHIGLLTFHLLINRTSAHQTLSSELTTKFAILHLDNFNSFKLTFRNIAFFSDSCQNTCTCISKYFHRAFNFASSTLHSIFKHTLAYVSKNIYCY